MDYCKETREAYQTHHRATVYQAQYSKFAWARFATWREHKCIKKALMICSLDDNDSILDIPCGTGILSSALTDMPCKTVASDISKEMMTLAHGVYTRSTFRGFVQADATAAPFRSKSFTCVALIGLLHRVPSEIRGNVLKEIADVSSKFIIVTYSVDSTWQRLKHWVKQRLLRNQGTAPCPVPLRAIRAETALHGLKVIELFRPLPLLSSEVILLLGKA